MASFTFTGRVNLRNVSRAFSNHSPSLCHLFSSSTSLKVVYNSVGGRSAETLGPTGLCRILDHQATVGGAFAYAILPPQILVEGDTREAAFLNYTAGSGLTGTTLSSCSGPVRKCETTQPPRRAVSPVRTHVHTCTLVHQ